MTEYALGLIPDYGLYVIFTSVLLACLAVPLPASLLVLAGGSFAAAGDLVTWQVLSAAFFAFVLGDQLAYSLARRAGPGLLRRARRSPRMAAVVARSDALVQQRGHQAVLLSHTIVSPTCPYVSYLCGAGGMDRGAFSLYAILGAAVWTGVYVGLGYVFADQLTLVSEMLGNLLGVILSAAVVLVCLMWLRRQWHLHKTAADAPPDPPRAP